MAISPSVTSRIHNDSGSYFFDPKIDTLLVSYGKNRFQFNSYKELDSFLKSQIRQIRGSQIIIRSDRNLKYEYFKQMIELLKKYNLMKFELITTL
jgi:biopolymer transport protein ExbD